MSDCLFVCLSVCLSVYVLLLVAVVELELAHKPLQLFDVIHRNCVVQ